ncbi:apoptosis facilitator Bcl-2-like protein 14 isoform X1 [Rousettus aegyptiacus]|uniref:apoptosis facilitator Bcl-2-like protein 14 isoform X1 n=1 Tax=Rousettus aegyptiacus TaxID=9407 RepID=UPI00168CFF14|nr:apoptosis facilitator Bcl-2-like protein 14 isoform X1 [Rousettus aegyptiacus]XP_016011857.2 apoptosis facilitator Bcl-2-like protein 14 isoform X1 [Rousettus aegyptiacus]
MCTTSVCDLEEISLDDDDPNSIEFKILEFYVKHHVFKNTSAVFSPKLLRTRSLSQKGVGSQSANESWTQVSWPCRNSRSSEKPISLAKKKSSWRTLFGVIEKEEDSPSSPSEIQAESLGAAEYQGRLHGQQRSRTLSNVEQRLEPEAVDPKVVSIANRVAEIVYSWPPPEEHTQGGHFKTKGSVVRQGLHQQAQGSQARAASPKKEITDFPLTDGEDQIAKIVELLKFSGDQLERELKKDKVLMNSFRDGLTYSVFKTITDQFLRGVDTRGESEVKAQGFKAALAIDVMAKLTAIDNHPMNKVLGFGTKYLKENFSPWVQQHGGWVSISYLKNKSSHI